MINSLIGRTLATCGAVLLLVSSAAHAQVSKVAATPNAIFPKGTKGPATTFTGTAYVTSLVKANPTFTCNAGSVSFEPGARTCWHAHPAGQILLITDGTGYYQEEGYAVRLLHKGDVVQCQPGVKHWHGASPKLPISCSC